MDRPFPFVVARGRSGTTLLRAILDAHPDLAIPGESHFAVSFGERRREFERPGGFATEPFLRDLLRHWGFRRWELPEQDVRAAFDETPPSNVADGIRLAFALYARSRGKPRYGDKTPGFVLHIGMLAELFPEARFVHLIRDGRDVALSYLDTDFGVATLTDAAIYWERFVRAGRAAGNALGPGRYLEVRYEDLVADVERTTVRVCEHIDLPFDPAMLRYFERSASLDGLSHAEHHQNISLPPTSGLRDWRTQMAPADVALFEALAGDLLTELGYERATERAGVRAAALAARARAGLAVRRVARRGRKSLDGPAWMGTSRRRSASRT
jgi:sulfotransferase family protein